mmetsp:Transcript_26339/g.43450  ORF Transcript_26339/g.43450 Transcript_26339/m.43450 type:complete len:459 (-) Transcript_26339:478-1854(-)
MVERQNREVAGEVSVLLMCAVLPAMTLRKLQLLKLGALVFVPYANALVSDKFSDPLDGIQKSLTLNPKDLFYTPTTGKSLSTELIKDEHSIESMSFADVTWVSTHNSHANMFASGENVLRQVATNQEYSVYEQLALGVRGLMLDIEYRNGSLQCVHGFVEFSLLRDLMMNEIVPFLNDDEQCVITIDLETRGDVELIGSELRNLLEQVPELARRIFRVNDHRWENHTEWPTISEMREADQRVLILVDNAAVASNEKGIHFRYNVTIENFWKGNLDSCSPRNGIADLHMNIPWSMPYIAGLDRTWTRLFTMNHFCCSTGIESLHRCNPSRIGGGDNGWGTMFPRIMLCIAESRLGRKPNFVAVDWFHIGDVHEIVDYMNFGGMLGVGQRCETGLDCATGSCSAEKLCHCQLCSVSTSADCNGCEYSTWNARLPSGNAAILPYAKPLSLVSLCLLYSIFS